MNVFALNYDGTWLSFSFSDRAMLNATLFCVAEHRDLLMGTENSADGLQHKGEVIRLINKRLADQRDHLSDSSIASVAILNNWEVWLRPFGNFLLWLTLYRR